MIHLDSCLLIDLVRETSRERPGAAFDVMESLDESEVLAVSVYVLCELRAGAELSRRPLKEHEAIDQVLAGLLVAYPDERFPAVYGRLFAAGRKGSRAPSAMDLLIASAALVDDAPLVTRNVRDFSRMPGLRLVRY
jgi:tRNA(fMet)-specific endonuclease VapC